MIKEVEVIAVCDLNQDRLKATAKKYSTKPVYRLSKDVGEGGTGRRIPDNASSQLYDIVVDCLKQGLNLFIEKPLGLTRSQTESLAGTLRDTV
ncbi:MAG: hypothetical protein QXN53_00940 [Thermoproteota archaeon]